MQARDSLVDCLQPAGIIVRVAYNVHIQWRVSHAASASCVSLWWCECGRGFFAGGSGGKQQQCCRHAGNCQ